MSKTTAQGKLHEMRGEIKRRWGKLTNDDLDQIEGDAQKLLGKLQQHYGYAIERAQHELDQLLAKTTKVASRRA